MGFDFSGRFYRYSKTCPTSFVFLLDPLQKRIQDFHFFTEKLENDSSYTVKVHGMYRPTLMWKDWLCV